jgi:cell division protein FtsW
MNNWVKSNLRGDYQLWIIVTILAVMSFLVTSSAASMNLLKYHTGSEHFLLKHSFALLLSLFIIYRVHKVEYHYWAKISRPIMILSALLVVYAYFFGSEINHAKRWIAVPLFGTFQPSDLAKVALIINLAAMLASRQYEEYTWKTIRPMLGWCIFVCATIALSNVSTAILLLGTCFLLMFIGRVPRRYLLILIGGGVSCAVFFTIIALSVVTIFGKVKKGEKPSVVVTRIETAISRVKSYASGEVLDQQALSYMAIAKGGLIGRGAGHSQQRNFLSQSDSDFVYAIIVEEWGLIGGIFTICLYLWLLYRGMKAVDGSGRAFGGLLSAGLTFSLVIQALVNMGTATGTTPVAGQTLPMISMGGTSLFFTGVALGIVISVSRDRVRDAVL